MGIPFKIGSKVKVVNESAFERVPGKLLKHYRNGTIAIVKAHFLDMVEIQCLPVDEGKRVISSITLFPDEFEAIQPIIEEPVQLPKELVLKLLLDKVIRYHSIDHHIVNGWIDTSDVNSFRQGFIQIHKGSAVQVEDWSFDFYSGHGSKVGSPTSSSCITAFQLRIEDGEKKYEHITTFKWNEVIPNVFKRYNQEEPEQLEHVQLALF